MIKDIHIIFALLSFASFSGRIVISELEPLALKKVVEYPHIIDTTLLLSGIWVAIEGGWLNQNYDWLVAKLIGLLAYILFGIFAMRSHGKWRWPSFALAICCFVYIAMTAMTKEPFWFI